MKLVLISLFVLTGMLMNACDEQRPSRPHVPDQYDAPHKPVFPRG